MLALLGAKLPYEELTYDPDTSTHIKSFIQVDPILISQILAKWNCLFGRGDFPLWKAPASLTWKRYIEVILGTE